MRDLLNSIGMPWILLGLIVAFFCAPKFVLQVTLTLYPRNDDRRRELLAEYHARRYLERVIWVAEQIETALFEGMRERPKGRNRLSQFKKKRKKKTIRFLGVRQAPVISGHTRKFLAETRTVPSVVLMEHAEQAAILEKGVDNRHLKSVVLPHSPAQNLTQRAGRSGRILPD